VDGDEPERPKNFNLSNSTEVSKVILKISTLMRNKEQQLEKNSRNRD